MRRCGTGDRFGDQAADFAPGDELDVVLPEQLTKRVAAEKVEVALTPRRSPVRVIVGCRSHLGIVIGEMHDQLGDAGLQILQRVGVEALRWNARFDGDESVDDDIIRSEKRDQIWTRGQLFRNRCRNFVRARRSEENSEQRGILVKCAHV